jgi:hypothetical protein
MNISDAGTLGVRQEIDEDSGSLFGVANFLAARVTEYLWCCQSINYDKFNHVLSPRVSLTSKQLFISSYGFPFA